MNAPDTSIRGHEAHFAAQELAEARELARTAGLGLAEALERTFGQEPSEFVARLAGAVALPWCGPEALHGMEPDFGRLPFADAQRRGCLLARAPKGAGGGWVEDLLLVLSDPFDHAVIAWADELAGEPFGLVLAHRGDIAACLARHEESMRALDGVAGSTDQDGARAEGEDLSLARIQENASPVVKLVNSTLYDALKTGASDIHLEMSRDGLVIRYRVDGVLSDVAKLEGQEQAEQVISRLKVMSQLDISERRVPQDGRFKVASREREIDLRVSIMPTIFGEDAVLRILDKQSLSDGGRGLRLERLGFVEEALVAIRALAREPYGMLLVTGPTGSGKTTTLYAALSEINDGHDKIVTIEDPVEYQLAGVTQIPVNDRKGLGFARGLRSILRHDPDRIMVGEIRDPETAQIAIQAALTGHLVFTTVHANGVFDVVSRFTHMGVDPYAFVSALNGIVAQRLVRQLCERCAVEDTPDPLALRAAGWGGAGPTPPRWRSALGCAHCRGSGYRGRAAIAELLLLDDALRDLIASREPLGRLKQAARERGMQSLRQAALDMAAQGRTSLQEVNRVTLVERAGAA